MGDLWDRFYGEVHHPEFPVREGDRVETMDKIRRLTAEHMVLAKRVAPHVHSFIEIDFSAVDRIRRENKARWAEQGARVSYTAFVAWACSRILRDFPQVNGTVSGNNIIYRGAVNLGMAVDLNPGLIVPVIHDTDDLSLVGIGKKIIDLAERARTKKLSPHEVQGATFSITNPGVLGTMVGMPVIPKGTSAILGTGSIEKRVVVVTDPETGADAMAIRKRSYFSLGLRPPGGRWRRCRALPGATEGVAGGFPPTTREAGAGTPVPESAPERNWADRRLAIHRCGLVPYGDALAVQERCVVERRERGPDRLLLLEHPHVITSGSGGDPAHVLEGRRPWRLAAWSASIRAEGGDVTYHGPGQLVGYPILDLKPDRKDLHAYLRSPWSRC